MKLNAPNQVWSSAFRRFAGGRAFGRLKAELQTKFSAVHRAAFSLIEMMVVVALMTVIILGLMMMFGQVQRAFRASITQTDVLEGGRAVADMLSRELAEMTPSYQSQVTNFYAQIPAATSVSHQALPGANGESRINVLEKLFFLTRENQTWTGYGYLVDDNGSGVGTLYRYTATTNVSQNPGTLYRNFSGLLPGNAGLHRVMDGVVQFRFRAFDTDGGWITRDWETNHINISDIKLSGFAPGEVGLYVFKSNAVPAYVEFELGILEKRIYERFKAMPDYNAQTNYLARQVGAVHLFRQRVPIRTVDVKAYQ
jgi:Prokaryotic N-terminal methylation motif